MSGGFSAKKSVTPINQNLYQALGVSCWEVWTPQFVGDAVENCIFYAAPLQRGRRWLVANGQYQGGEWVIHNVSESSIPLEIRDCNYFHAKAEEVDGKLVMKPNSYRASPLLPEYRKVRMQVFQMSTSPSEGWAIGRTPDDQILIAFKKPELTGGVWVYYIMPVEGGHLVCVDKSTQLIQQKINKKGYEAKFTELAENLNRF